MGDVLNTLKRTVQDKNTVVIFVSDNGGASEVTSTAPLRAGKCYLFEGGFRVPLIVSAPGIKPGRTSSFVELVDLYPTWTDLLGLPMPKGLHGKSLTPILRNPDAKVRDTALSIHNRAGGGLRSAQWHYMNYAGKGEELYDMIKDPDQYTNVVSDPKYAAILKQARAQYKARMAAAR